MFALAGYASVEESYSILAVVGVIDIMFAIIISVGVIMEAQYLPINFGSCRGATSWRPNANGTSFFQEAMSASQFEGYNSPEAICRGMVENWALLIGVM